MHVCIGSILLIHTYNLDGYDVSHYFAQSNAIDYLCPDLKTLKIAQRFRVLTDLTTSTYPFLL